eukprot:TCONS_00016645-protein
MDDEDDDTSQIVSGENFAQQFTGSFRSKLKLLKSPDRNESCSEELQALQTYVGELSEQNEILVQTIEDLENDSNDRVLTLENKLISTSELLKERSTECDSLYHQIKLLKMEKEKVNSHFKVLEEESITMGEESLQFQSHINNLENDIDQLIYVIKKARTTGKWELSKLNLKAIPLENLLDTTTIVEPLPRNNTELATENHVDELKVQILARDETINKLERELKKKTEQYHGVLHEISHSGEMVDSVRFDVNYLEKKQQSTNSIIAQKDIHIKKLESQILSLEQSEQELSEESNKQHEEIITLKREINALEDSISMRIVELDNKNQSIKILERQLLEFKEKNLMDSIREEEVDGMKLQLNGANNKIKDLQLYISELTTNNTDFQNVDNMVKEKEMTIRKLQQQLTNSGEASSKQTFKLQDLTRELGECKRKLAKLQLESTAQRSDVEENLNKEVERKERELRLLQSQIKRIEEQKNDNDSKVELRDKAIERLQHQQKEYMDEVTRRDNAIHTLELRLLKIEDEKKRSSTELERLTKKHDSMSQDYRSLKEKHTYTQTEKGKVDAKLKAYQISNESEQSAMVVEATKKEEVIQQLRQENLFLADEKQQAVDLVQTTNQTLKELEIENTELTEKISTKEKIILDREMVLSQLKTKADQYKVKIEKLEDNARDFTLKLNAAERAREEETHQSALNKHHAEELLDEVQALLEEKQSLLEQINAKNISLEETTFEFSALKKTLLSKEKQLAECLDLTRQLERKTTSSSTELSELKRETSNELATRDHKIVMLEEEIELSQQRYSDVNEELTNTEMQLEAANKNYREMFDLKDALETKLQSMISEMEELEMSLSLTAEKHKTSAQQNAQKDGLILNLQSELDATQQEFETAIEEIGQRTEENEKLLNQLTELKAQHHQLQVAADESSNKVEELVDQINQLQNTNIKQHDEIQQLHDEMKNLAQEIRMKDQNFKQETEAFVDKMRKFENESRESEEMVKDLKLQVASLSEKNAELRAENNAEADQRQNAACQLDEVNEKFEDLKLTSDEKIRQQADQILHLESSLHSSSLKVSKLEGSLELSEEKLKNVETQFSDLEKHSDSLEQQVEELKQQLSEEHQTYVTTNECVENLQEANKTQANQLHQQTLKLNTLKSEMKTSTDLLNESKLRNTRCEEIIREMREKLSNKLKESEQQGKMLTQHNLQINHLEATLHQVREELTESKKALLESEHTSSQLKMKLSEKNEELAVLENNNEDMNENLRELLSEKDTQYQTNVLLQDKFDKLKGSLEKDNFNLLEENCSLKQKVKEIEDTAQTLEEINKAKSEESVHLDNMVNSLKMEISKKSDELEQKKDEVFSCEETVNELHAQCQTLLEEKKSLIVETSNQLSEINKLRTDLTELRQLYKENSQQLAHYQEKSDLFERNLSTTQDELSTRITEIVKLEKISKKSQTDLKKVIDDKKHKEIKIGQYKQLLEQSNADLKLTKTKCQQFSEENKAHKSALISYENQLNNAHNQTEQMSIDIESKENALKDYEHQLSQTQDLLDVTREKLSEVTQLLEEQQSRTSILSERENELLSKLRERESSNNQLHTELEASLKKNKSCLEKVAAREAEVRVLKADLHAQQKKCSHQGKYLKRNNEQIDRYEKEIKNLQDTSQQALSNASTQETSLERLTMDLSQCQAKLDECMDQLARKSKELVNVKADLVTLQQDYAQTEQQSSFTDNKNKRLKTELKKALEKNKSTAAEMSQLIQNISELKIQLQSNLDERGKLNHDLNKRDEQIITLKVDCASLDERLKLMDEENDRLKNESLQLSQQHHRTMEQLHRTQQELSAVKVNGDRLTRESGMVVENMNTWVKEQRHGNEKLASQLGQQKDKIFELEQSNRSLSDDNGRLRNQNSGLRKSIDERKSEKEKFEKQRIHMAELQVNIRELQGKLQNMEETLQQERLEKNEQMNELQVRNKSNVDTIQQLHQQLSDLNKENLRQRTLLEKQSASRKNLQAQLRSKENDFELLNRSYNELESTSYQSRGSYGPTTKSSKVASMLEKELDKSQKDNYKDKNYWKERVGQLSSKLKNNEEYWANRLRTQDLNNKEFESDSDF